MAVAAKKIDDTRAEALADLDAYVPRTPLGKKLVELRRAHIEAGGELLDWEGIQREVAERRGGVGEDS